LEQYKNDLIRQSAVERFFQVAIECCTDIANHIIVAYGLKRPTQRKEVFQILYEAGYLEKNYADVMMKMVQLRNRLVHIYWNAQTFGLPQRGRRPRRCIDPESMYNYLQNDIVFLEKFKVFTIGIIKNLSENP